jgi:hypothetical protein
MLPNNNSVGNYTEAPQMDIEELEKKVKVQASRPRGLGLRT